MASESTVPVQSICRTLESKSPLTGLRGRRNQMMTIVIAPIGGVIPAEVRGSARRLKGGAILCCNSPGEAKRAAKRTG